VDRVWRQVNAGPRDALEHRLNPADLQTLLLAVTRRRAAAVTPARLMSRWEDDRYVRPSTADPRRIWRLEARLWDLLPAEFTGIDLSPVAPLGVCSAIAPVSQDRVISTIRGTEVVSDQTNVLALEAARRRRTTRAPVVHLASCHQVLRAQPYDSPGFFQHFRLFALVSTARDRGSGTTEAALLTAHLGFWTRALGELLPRSRATVSFTVFGFLPLHERIRDMVLPALEPLPETVIVAEDPGRQRARGYYERGAIRIDVGPVGQPQEVGDGGFTDWTAQLLSDAKERCFISCISTARLAAHSSLAGIEKVAMATISIPAHRTPHDVARQRVTRDLHDCAQQQLLSAIINLELAAQDWSSAPEQAKESLDRVLSDARASLDSLREFAAVLLLRSAHQPGQARAGQPACAGTTLQAWIPLSGATGAA